MWLVPPTSREAPIRNLQRKRSATVASPDQSSTLQTWASDPPTATNSIRVHRVHSVDSVDEKRDRPVRTPFVTHLITERDAGRVKQASVLQAIEYLAVGPPFFGDYKFAAISVLKSHQAQFLSRFATKGQTKGRLAAPSEAVLLTLLQSKRVAQDDPTHVAEGRIWVPCRPLPLAAADAIVVLWRNFNSTKATVPQRCDIPVDEAYAVHEMADRYGVVWTSALAAWSTEQDEFGPHTGVSSIRRTLRALAFGLVARKTLLFDKMLPPPVRRTPAAGRVATRAVHNHASNGVKFSNSDDHATAMLATSPPVLQVGSAKRTEDLSSRCLDCNAYVDEQFDECRCGMAWATCTLCMRLCCVEQVCRCVSSAIAAELDAREDAFCKQAAAAAQVCDGWA